MGGLTRLRLPTLPLHPSHPLIHATCDITAVLKKVAQNPAGLTSRNSYKILANTLLYFYSESSVATIWHKRATVALIFQIGISRNTKCDNSVGFSKSGHILK